jgi:putative salt-induced outer membrane protein
MKRLPKLFVICCLPCAAAAFAQGQATLKQDGQWRAALGLGASYASGNTRASTLSASGDAVRASEADKFSLYGNSLYGKSNGTVNAQLFRLGTRYDRNLSGSLFGFGTLDFEKDKIAKLKLRSAAGVGLGLHLVKTTDNTFDVFGGAGYTADRYDAPRLVDGAARERYNYANLLLGEESSHKLSESTSAKQRLVIYPNLKNRGEYRAQWDASLGVAMTQSMNLNVGLAVRRDSNPGPGIKTTDTLLTTGISVKFD